MSQANPVVIVDEEEEEVKIAVGRQVGNYDPSKSFVCTESKATTNRGKNCKWKCVHCGADKITDDKREPHIASSHSQKLEEYRTTTGTKRKTRETLQVD